MLRRKFVPHFAVSCALIAVGLWACGTGGSGNSSTANSFSARIVRVHHSDNQNPASTSNSFSARTHIADYRQWNRVNPQPVIFHAASAEQCANPRPSQMPGPHLDKYITVYVNKIARNAMMTQKTPNFPVGSVIVKEKDTTADPSTRELLTVMVKREKGFNPGSGDWEYAVTDGTGTQVQAQGQLRNCQSCHLQQKYQDYVFRDPYFPANLVSQLK